MVYNGSDICGWLLSWHLGMKSLLPMQFPKGSWMASKPAPSWWGPLLILLLVFLVTLMAVFTYAYFLACLDKPSPVVSLSSVRSKLWSWILTSIGLARVKCSSVPESWHTWRRRGTWRSPMSSSVSRPGAGAMLHASTLKLCTVVEMIANCFSLQPFLMWVI